MDSLVGVADCRLVWEQKECGSVNDCSHTSTFMKDENTLKEERMKSVEMCMRDILSEPFIQREYECGLLRCGRAACPVVNP